MLQDVYCKTEGTETSVCEGRYLLALSPPVLHPLLPGVLWGRGEMWGEKGHTREDAKTLSEPLCKVVLNMQHHHKYISISPVWCVRFLWCCGMGGGWGKFGRTRASVNPSWAPGQGL